MASDALAPDSKAAASRPQSDAFAGLLSYLVPGLGQIYQGRISKGVIFLVCLYGLFFTGMYLGSWKNVYIPDVSRNNPGRRGPAIITNLWNRLQFLGQFWIGVAAWPAILQYHEVSLPFLKDFQRAPEEDELNRLQQEGDKTWDLGWVYTVIAGALNVLVIYDAVAGAVFSRTSAGGAADKGRKTVPQEAHA